MRYFLSFAILFAGISAGCLNAFSSWGGTTYVPNAKYVSIRNPAYVDKLAPYSELKGKAWNLLSRDRLPSEAFPIHEQARSGIVFGHFVTQDIDGKKLFACDLYNKIQLSFVAEGVMENGEITRMNVEAPCRATTDLDKLETVWIPNAEILAQPTSPSLDLDFPANNVHIKFSNLTSQWPKQWLLEEVRLVQEQNSVPSLRLDSEEIARTAKSPIYLNW